MGRALRVPVAPRELQARFNGLGAAVAEEGAIQTGASRERRGDFGLQRMKEQVRRVEQRVRLRRDRVRQARVRVAERRDADARK